MANADYTGKDERMKFLFQNSGGGTQCLYDASAVASILAAVNTANLGIAEIIEILGGGGSSGSQWSEPGFTDTIHVVSHWTITEGG